VLGVPAAHQDHGSPGFSIAHRSLEPPSENDRRDESRSRSTHAPVSAESLHLHARGPWRAARASRSSAAVELPRLELAPASAARTTTHDRRVRRLTSCTEATAAREVFEEVLREFCARVP